MLYKKEAIIVLLFSIIPFFGSAFVFNKIAYSGNDFSFEIESKYSLVSENHLEVFFVSTITNLNQEVVLSQQSIETGFEDIYDVTANSDNKQLKPEISSTAGVINVTYPNPIVGKGITYKVAINYKTTYGLRKKGSVLEISIPKVTRSNDIQGYTVTILSPKIFGIPSFSSPSKYILTENEKYNLFLFPSDTVFDTGINMYFGDFQNYSFEIYYEIVNDSLIKKSMGVPLPPTIQNYQQSFIKKITPSPESIKIDNDGNYLAYYSVQPNGKITVLATGFATVKGYKFNSSLSKRIDELPTNVKVEFTKSLPFWDSENAKIKETAQKYFNANLTTYQNAEALYKFVINTLDYDTNNKNRNRLGAIKALESRGPAVCVEYSDLLIALYRSVGIPSREVQGFAYSEDLSAKPVSLIFDKELDLLHSWVQFYDSSFGWVSVDPTWGDTSGLDYFNNMDLNHLSFVIKGESSTSPLPPGFYKDKENNSKQIKVDFLSGQIPQDAMDINSLVIKDSKASKTFSSFEFKNILEISLIVVLCGTFCFAIYHLAVRSK
jgi:transglutaminase-like putative cysteine protease